MAFRPTLQSLATKGRWPSGGVATATRGRWAKLGAVVVTVVTAVFNPTWLIRRRARQRRRYL